MVRYAIVKKIEREIDTQAGKITLVHVKSRCPFCNTINHKIINITKHKIIFSDTCEHFIATSTDKKTAFFLTEE